ESTARLTIAVAKRKMLAARIPRQTPYVDTTMYVSWNAMFVSAYLDAARVLDGGFGSNCRTFALKTLDRMLREVWSESRGFGHRLGGPALEGSLDDQVFGVIALLDAYEATLEPRYFEAAKRTMDLAIERYADAEGGGFFDRPFDAAPMGGLEVRRKPFQDSPTPGANSAAAIALTRMHAFTGEERYRAFAQKTLEAFAGIAPQYGLFAATYGLAATLFTHHPLQIVVTGRADDPAAQALEAAAHRVYRLGKSVLRVTPGASLANFAGALKETLPHLPADKAAALVCAGQTCLPPTSDPSQLTALLENGAASATAAAN
ncbi:MAG: thioredoxin domain-containing protein, partial [Candidatus Acidiferrum sp.]